MKVDERLFYDDFENLVNISIERLEFGLQHSRRLYNKPLYIAFSGGKDSVCLYGLSVLLAKKLNKPLEEVANFYYNVTNVDPPDLVQFIKKEYPFVKWNLPKKSMWELIIEHGLPPLRMVRYCCEKMKEVKVKDVVMITGVRWAESLNRKNNRTELEISKTSKERRTRLKLDNEDNRREIENCMKFNQIIINPIVDWNEEDVWLFINSQKLKYCKLYDEGYKRLGCIGCPMASEKERCRQFERYPKYKEQYIRTFDKMLELHPKTTFESGKDCFYWWVFGGK